MPLQVVPATAAVLEHILNDTFPLWGDGLSRENYAKEWAAQLKTPWGQHHLDRVALVDGPHVLSSAKRYDLSLRIDGRIEGVIGVHSSFVLRKSVDSTALPLSYLRKRGQSTFPAQRLS